MAVFVAALAVDAIVRAVSKNYAAQPDYDESQGMQPFLRRYCPDQVLRVRYSHLRPKATPGLREGV